MFMICFKLSLNVQSNLCGYRTNRLGGNSFKVEIRVRFPLPMHKCSVRGTG